ncbi:hypothetical protein BH10CYA1_BH10CYA1_38850 [soil metagenome]
MNNPVADTEVLAVNQQQVGGAEGSAILNLSKKSGLPRTPVALALYLVASIIVFGAALVLPSLEDICCFSILGEKHRILESAASSQKIIFTGGSNVLYGFDGEKIGRTFNRKVVNMGLCLMFPLAYLFEEIKDTIKPGDIVVVAPEYSSYSLEMAAPMSMANIIEGYPRAIEWILRSNSCTWEEKGKIIFHMRKLGIEKLNYVMTHARQIAQHRCTWSFNKFNPGLEILSPKNLDSCGGLIWQLNRPTPPSTLGGPEVKIPLRVVKHCDPYTVGEIEKFAKYCRSRNAQFVLMPPSVGQTMYLKGKPGIDSLMAEVGQKLDVPILATPERYAFPDSMIFGGHYHLDKVGRQIRTQKMIEDLRDTVTASRTEL